MQNLFVYGTLLFPEILQKITGKNFGSGEATLPGYRRHAVKNCDYPAIIQNKNEKVEGKLILNVDDESMKLLSDYEGEEYKKAEVEVQSGDSKIMAVVFVWCDSLDKLMENDWDENHFGEHLQKGFIEKNLI